MFGKNFESHDLCRTIVCRTKKQLGREYLEVSLRLASRLRRSARIGYLPFNIQLSQIYLTFFGPKTVTSVTRGPDLPPLVQTLPKAQRTQECIEYFDSFNIFSSKQRLQQALNCVTISPLLLMRS